MLSRFLEGRLHNSSISFAFFVRFLLSPNKFKGGDFLLLARMDKVKKYYGNKLILDIDKLEINEGDKIGLVGVNGAGKTTLLKALIGEEEIDSGSIFLTESFSYISQDIRDIYEIEKGLTQSLFNSLEEYQEYLSGGEKVKIKVSSSIEKNRKFLIADEPTANMDSKSINLLEKTFKNYKGSLILVCHDREFLDSICNGILEINNGRLKYYKGNYSKYMSLKEKEKERLEFEYNQYVSEKQRLEEAVEKKKEAKDRTKAPPKRMGNSEARLHKMGGQTSKKKQDQSIKAVKTRINKLEVKEKPNDDKEVRITVQENMIIESKNLIEGKDFDLIVGDRILLEKAKFKVKKGKKIALIGENGSGKSSLLKEILKGKNENIRISKKLVIGYFDQTQGILDENKTIIENIKEESSYNENFIRINLNRFGFNREEVLKKVSVLSGGEKVKVALCKTLLSDNNILILDEPTNYLDVLAVESLEKALIDTNKTVVIVSHDRRFVNNVCNYILEIKNKKIIEFNGNYIDYVDNINKPKLNKDEKEKANRLFTLENELSQLISLLSIEKDEGLLKDLEIKYDNVLKDIKELKA